MIKNNLKQIITNRGIKQNWLADQVGITKQTMSSLINNRYSTSIDIALKLSEILNIDIKDIFYNDEKLK